MLKYLRILLLFILLLGSNKIIYCTSDSDTSNTGLLFYLSGENGYTADYSAGDGEPNFLSEIEIIEDGAKGKGFQCGNTQLFSYMAAGNIFAERGTLGFYWRARDPYGKTPFVIFRVGYSDHSSWDMVWLRIDYNGNGFDAFVTDANLARERVSYQLPKTPSPTEWVHFTLAWDETTGIKFFINGNKVAEKDTASVLYSSLDQFGPHSRIISSYQVQSAYQFIRGGDIDEIKIYDHALSENEVKQIADGKSLESAQVERNLSNSQWKDEWNLRYGWNRTGDHPPYLKDKETSVRKVEIHEVYDLKRWWWKANDGIRETTWPAVYNRSRILGRNDYFQLPDWDCYPSSGKSIRFNMPEETWNYFEVQGAAFGNIELSDNQDGLNSTPLFDRSENQERTFHKLNSDVQGKTLIFKNDEIETPIGEINVFNIKSGNSPKGMGSLEYELTTAIQPENLNIRDIKDYISGRYSKDERITMLALPSGAPSIERKSVQKGLPIIHVIIPSGFRSIEAKRSARGGYSYTWDNLNAGLDGIEIEIPALNVKPTISEFFPLNIQVKDPIWPLRNMFDFSFSVKPNEARTLWIDLRDRILPNNTPLYFTIAASGEDFKAEMLEGAKIKLIFKPWNEAKKEHIIDRFTQVRDNYDMIIEEHTRDRRLNKYVQFESDMTSLLQVEPDHYPGRNYWYIYNREQPKPAYQKPLPPKDVPLWAFLQVENLKGLENIVDWYIDNREIQNEGLGGGLSDDSDLENTWPGLALMGYQPEKIKASNQDMMEAIYNNGMLTKGITTIQTDGLHQYEEGINVLAQVNMNNFGDPKNVERMMESAKSLNELIIAKNNADHYHFRSQYFSATKVAQEGVWAYSSNFVYLALHPAILLGEYYGNEAARNQVINIVDGLLAHARKDENGRIIIDTDINFNTDESRNSPLAPPYSVCSSRIFSRGNSSAAIHALWASYKWTGNKKYLQPLLDMKFCSIGTLNPDIINILDLNDEWGKDIISIANSDKENDLAQHLAWQLTGNNNYLEDCYSNQIQWNSILDYINTTGSLWTDRVITYEDELQRARLGGIAIARGFIFPGNAVSWKFEDPNIANQIAIAISSATNTDVHMKVFNMDENKIKVECNSWNLLPGNWKVTQGIDTNDDGIAETEISSRTITFERSKPIEFIFPSHKNIIVDLKLVQKGLDYSERCDLAVGKDDIKIDDKIVNITVHNLGAINSRETNIVLKSLEGKIVSEAYIPEIKAPNDLIPKIADVTLNIPDGINLNSLSIQIDPEEKLTEITRENNFLKLISE
ncbi:MAG: hypothetical protein KDC88_00885 [Ignavibacteriae bacterium]|nr:hypothetical protein [Ignavibacteriota bacterium]